MKRKSLLLLPLLLASPLSAQGEAAPAKRPATPAEPAAETDPAIIQANSSYGFGYNNGNSFRQQMSRFALSVEDIDRDKFIEGFFHSLEGKDPEQGQDVLNAAMLGLRNQVQEREKVRGEANLKKTEAFLTENKAREGVITTDSGLQYEIIKAGDGEKYDNSENAKFMVNYRGSLMDGSQFDASPEGTPVAMNLNVVAGFREALTTMPVGSKWKLFIKPELGYGENRRSAQLGPNSLLIFDVELVEIQKPAPRPRAVSPPIQIPPAPTKK